MKEKIGKYIVWGNIGIAAVFYICATVFMGGSAASFSGFLFTLLHVGINVLIGVLLTIAYYATHRSRPTLGKAMRGFWLSAGLVALVSFPTCLLAGNSNNFVF